MPRQKKPQIGYGTMSIGPLKTEIHCEIVEIGIIVDCKVCLTVPLQIAQSLQYSQITLRCLVKFKIKNPQIPIILRVNDTDIARGSNYIDSNTLSVSKISDITIFVSNWVKNYYLKKKN